MLRLDDVRVTRDGFVLRADWEAPAPGRVAVIGPSGAGKSTLLDLIAGFAAPDAGRVLWNGRDVTGEAPAARPVALLFQDNNLFPHLSVGRNLALALRPGGGRLSEGEQARIAHSLDRVGLSGFGDRRPGSLSGGQQSRAALARVLLQDKPILALDEPFAALGPALKADMLALVAEIADEMGALVFLVTHDPEDARRFAPRTVLVDGGVAAAPADTDALFADPPPGLAAYLGA